jgi:anti-anti-sigma factor
MSEFSIEVRPGPQEGVRILHLIGPFRLQQVWEFQAVMRASEEPVTIIDLTDVPYMDSASLGALMGAHVLCQKNKRQYALVGVSERHRLLFEVGGVEKLLVIYDNVEQAVTQLAEQKAAGNTA